MLKRYGWTTSEIILVLAIIGILVAVGMVIFEGTHCREDLLRAKRALQEVAREEAAYKARHGSYPPAGAHVDYLPFFGGNGKSGSGKKAVFLNGYRIEIVGGGRPDAFTVRATPRPGGPMAYKKGQTCSGWLSLDEKGHRDSQSVPNAWP